MMKSLPAEIGESENEKGDRRENQDTGHKGDKEIHRGI
jgi:hypothetical protein